MKLAREKVDLTWLGKSEHEILLKLWQNNAKWRDEWVSEQNCYAFRRTCHRDKGRGTTTQYIRLIVRQFDTRLQIEVHNPSTYCTSTALLPLDDLPASPRQFQKQVFAKAQGDANTLSASKSNLRLAWTEFLAHIETMPVVEHHELHIDNSDEGWIE